MTFVFLGLLALAWIAIFLPAMLRARAEAPMWTTERFKRKMDALAPRGGRWVVMPTPHEHLRAEGARRRQARLKGILIGFLVAVAVTFAAAVVAGGSVWELHVGTVGIAGIYVAWLRDAKRRRRERARKVRTISSASHWMRNDESPIEESPIEESAVAQRG